MGAAFFYAQILTMFNSQRPFAKQFLTIGFDTFTRTKKTKKL
tara:strand:+ start:89990 stop:90115 length:126 start_codon:yes stop_codon:yes gene_type:complete